ncbi:MAG: pseudouridine synthase [Bacteroidales bacterium]
MTNDNYGDGNPGGFTRQEGEGGNESRRERKPLFSTSFKSTNENAGENGGEGTGRKRPPRKRILIKPGSAPTSHSTETPPHPQPRSDDRIDHYSSRFYYSGVSDDTAISLAPGQRMPTQKKKVAKTGPKKYQTRRQPATGVKKKGKFKGAPSRNPKRPTLRKGPGARSTRPPYFPTVYEEPVRLNKYIAAAGICSRRDADKLIEAGEITVNGEVVTTLGARVNPGDVVMYKGQVLQSEPKYYVLLNKPKGFVTTMDDPEERQTVMDLVKNACKERIFPVGRLDRNTTGLLLLTNDGELAKKLTHPNHRIRKVYEVQLDRPLLKVDMMRIAAGLELEDGIAEVDVISYVGNGEDKSKIGIELHSGKNRIVRRIFEKLHYQVKKLDRVAFGSLTKKNLPRGRWRYLTAQEVNFLKML